MLDLKTELWLCFYFKYAGVPIQSYTLDTRSGKLKTGVRIPPPVLKY
jgi:hypothetical protein